MGILCTICVWHAIAPTTKETSPNADKWALIVFGSLYAGFHIFFFLYIFFVAIRKRWLFKQKDKEHKDRLKICTEKLAVIQGPDPADPFDSKRHAVMTMAPDLPRCVKRHANNDIS